MMSTQSTPSKTMPAGSRLKSTVRTPTDHKASSPSSTRQTPISNMQSSYILRQQINQLQKHQVSRQMTSGNNVKVVARFRPFNEIEKISQSPKTFLFHDDAKSLTIKTRHFQGGFTFDKIFDEDTSQLELYEYTIADTIIDLFEGFHGTILCYGQTGSGKTHSMMGDLEVKEMRGIIPRIGEQLFETISNGSSDIEYTVGVSYLEIYNETLKDLLAGDSRDDAGLKIIDDKINGIHVRNLTNVYISSKEEIYELMKRGNLRKVVSATNMNKESSRSHSIFQINLRQLFGNGTTKSSKLYLVDLAGSEKVEKTGASGQLLEEAKKINSSLSSLGNVINALTDGRSTHIPYRDSKLTRILQESLGGNSRTTLIINCSPSSLNDQETLSTLRFGARAKDIKNHALVNEELSSLQFKAKIDSLTVESLLDKSQIESLQRELQLYRSAQEHRMSNSSDGANSDITVVGVDEDCPKDISTVVINQPQMKEVMENSKDHELISLKMKVAELETTNEALIYDLRSHVERNVNLQLLNDELVEISQISVDKKLALKMMKKIDSLAIKFTKVQNKNDDLVSVVKNLENMLQLKDLEIARIVKSQSERLQSALVPRLQSPTDERARTARGSKVGFNLKIIKPLKGGEKY